MAFVSLILEWESCGNAGNLKNKEEERKKKKVYACPHQQYFAAGNV